ncbi:hypothetical protein llap_2465 [Limosa lapponica baueri]|uniref:Uncharacterized protein n=1 Tax=Limosa lapponica baueri TaxID=1758121 RepID=A0A2I0UMF2_LIMLA|nr:hypothetical protein llap_2465 [Limosa lapponica baueri]
MLLSHPLLKWSQTLLDGLTSTSLKRQQILGDGENGSYAVEQPLSHPSANSHQRTEERRGEERRREERRGEDVLQFSYADRA